MDEIYKITPVLTVFNHNVSNSSSLTSQFTCLKVITTRHLSNDSENSASSLGYDLLAITSLSTAALAFLW